MDLREFVKDVLVNINAAVDEARLQTSRDIRFSDNDSMRTIEFDIAVAVEANDHANGKAGIKVLQFAEAGGNISQENKNSTVSRITFGLKIEASTKAEAAENQALLSAHRANMKSNFHN